MAANVLTANASANQTSLAVSVTSKSVTSLRVNREAVVLTTGLVCVKMDSPASKCFFFRFLYIFSYMYISQYLHVKVHYMLLSVVL